MNVLITGVGKGIGRALAEKFLGQGHSVLGTFFDPPVPEFAHPRLTLIPLDLSNGESVTSAVKFVDDSRTRFDILINNAGALFDEDNVDVDIEKLRKTLAVNLIGPINFTESLLPLVKDGGHIVNISSTAGSLALAGEGASHFPDHYPAYRISKVALNMYTVTLSRRLSERRIIVSSVHPGWVSTDMGGPEADLTPIEAAAGIYTFAITAPESGRFWYRGEPLPW